VKTQSLVRILVLFFMVFGAAVGTANSQGSGSIVTWENNRVNQTIGNGQIVTPTVVKFRVAKALTNVSVYTVPGISKFVNAQPSEFPSLEPGTDYSITLLFSVPTGAAQGSYDGNIHLRLGSKTIPDTLKVEVTVDYGGNVPSPNTITLSAESLRLLSGVATDGNGLYFSQTNAELAAIHAGQILALPPVGLLPSGFLGRVVGVSNVGGQLFLSTTAASLSEALSKATISIDRPLNASDVTSSIATAAGASFRRSAAPLDSIEDGLSVQLNDLVVYDRDGNPATTSDQLVLDGSVTANPQLHFDFDIDDFHLKNLQFYIQVNESVELTIKSRLEASLFDGEKEFAHFEFGRIIIWVGWVPVVIVPEVALVARAKGTASVGIEVGVNQAAIFTAGLGYDDGDWDPIADFSSSFSFNGPSFSAGANIKGLVGPRFKLLLYGVIGPRADIDAFGEIDVDIFRTPIWQIFGGLEGSAGIHLQILDHTIADIEFPLIIQFRQLIAEGGTTGNGQIVGVVRDAITLQPLSNAVVAVFRDGSLIDSLVTDANGRFSLPALIGAVYKFNISHSGYLPVTYNNVTVLPNETKTLDVILQIDTAHSGAGNVSGFVFNAISGAGVPGLTVKLREGLNTPSGPVVVSTTTGPDGEYGVFSLPAGNYTAEAGGTGYTNSYFAILCIGGTTTGDQNGVISPALDPNQTRIVLTWGLSPSDLDSHFTGPLADGTRFHMFYPYADENSGSPWPAIVHLDLDDVTSFGPETTTLLQQIDGVYRFSVHDYTNRNSTISAALSNSQAQVRIYRGSNLVASFNVPLDQPGTLWTVFEMQGSTITPINSMTFEGNPDVITAPNRARGKDGSLLENLPPKP
jgi:hypothetical protein